ncbi:MAG TPA: PLP-dependent aminotransferase family protein [Gemmatimonadales bacterium]|nr:PLP-dependent aminotransferase family protein [Gemmatimonadales bacterium]
MSKRSAALPIALPPREPGATASEWLCAALRSAILEGRLPPDARLPATRELARQYGLARGTVVNAFDQLCLEGYLRGRVGSGTYVNAVLPDELLHAPRRSTARPERRSQPPPRRLSALGRRVRFLPGLENRPLRAFRANRPALDLFPTTLWAKLAARRIRRATTAHLLDSGPLGLPALQQAIAEYLTTARGVNCGPGQVVIVSGVQEAIDLAARVLVDPGDRVCIEDPGYIGAARIFEAHGAGICPVSVDHEGMLVPDARHHEVRLAYVTPAHQFPLGVSMSLSRRLALLEWARGNGTLIFEDDYDSEYRFAGRPLPALQGLDRHGVVLFAGSFSKVLFPSLRIGYLVVPPDLVDCIVAAKSVVGQHAPLLDQAVLTDFITEGHFGRHVRRMREVYAERLGVLQEESRIRLAGLMEIGGIDAGLQTTGWLGERFAEMEVVRAAARRDVEVVPVGRYARRPMQRPVLQLGFAAVDPPEIRRGVRDLARALEELSR